MISRAQTLSSGQISLVITKGKSKYSKFFSLKVLKKDGKSRFAIAISKKVAKKAVLRNKIKNVTISFMSTIYTNFIFTPLYNFLIYLFDIFPWFDAGIIVIIFTCCVKLALFPFSKKALVKTALNGEKIN